MIENVPSLVPATRQTSSSATFLYQNDFSNIADMPLIIQEVHSWEDSLKKNLFLCSKCPGLWSQHLILAHQWKD